MTNVPWNKIPMGNRFMHFVNTNVKNEERSCGAKIWDEECGVCRVRKHPVSDP
jgi:hypothetical protein